MSRLIFYLRYAVRSLRRDGMRTFLAGLSVTFGVLSLVAMQLLSTTLLDGSMFDQRLRYGGDAQITAPQSGQPLTESDLAQFEAWKEQGLVGAYTPTSTSFAIYLRTPDNGRVTFLNDAIGIDPATYPLVGELVLREPSGATAADVLREQTDALITRDVADQLGLTVGDTFLLSSEGAPVELTVAGVASVTPSQTGDTVYFTLDTARLIENRNDVINAVSVNWGSVPGAADTIIASPYQVFVAPAVEDAVQNMPEVNLFSLMFKGAGVLGLLIGGISISNTLQVMLTRRKLEIAMLKTLGFKRGDLLALISLETGIIGLVGGIAGALIGTIIAEQLLGVVADVSSMMTHWAPDPIIVGGGLLAGLFTSVVFGLQAILAASSTRPVELLRDMPVKTPNSVLAVRLGLYGVMLAIFGVLVGVVLGSILEGIAFVFGGSLLLVLLRFVFWGVLWATLKLPVPRLPTLRMARANLRQRKMQSSLAVMALFAGAFSVTFAALAIYNAQTTVTNRRGSDAGYNLMVFTTVDGAADAQGQMILQSSADTYRADRVRGMVNGEPIMIEGRNAGDLNTDVIYDGEWADQDNVGLLPTAYDERYNVGDALVVSVNGQEQSLTLVGFYEVNSSESITGGTSALIVPRLVTQAIGGENIQVRLVGEFPVESLDSTTTAIGQALPNMLVFSRADVNDRLTTVYRSLFIFAFSVAGLAFVAGAVLIANAAGLTVVERRREIGVFKAVGYTSSRVLRLLLSEYGFLGALAGIFGVVAVIVVVSLINAAEPAANMVVEPVITAGMVLFSITIALVSAAGVSWQPARVRPLDVLRYE